MEKGTVPPAYRRRKHEIDHLVKDADECTDSIYEHGSSSVRPSSNSSPCPSSTPTSFSSSSSSSSSSASCTASVGSRTSSSTSSPAVSPGRNNSSLQRSQRKSVTRELLDNQISKRFSEPALLTFEDIAIMDPLSENDLEASRGSYRRCGTDTQFKTVHAMPSEDAPDLLELFNIFQFNKPEKPPARMLMNVTLAGSLYSVRLLVAHDASVQDVIRASLKAYVKEGRLPRHCIKDQSYGLHYSPFSLESEYSCISSLNAS
ncbi:hypothetical protein KP509_12G015100 [Ceratopteris richardii]|uniref:DUF7054 domain-containing protein n=1 Tax=Ceratopteris richardii TaxID=49495 RepID=A0A8T2TMA2_CERRI|nr:hypothetical protein KP509_12G015100 [Ceratopteris richardii]